MKLFPAIDLRGGRVVRLTRGDYDQMTTYFDDPVAVSASFREAGARHLHVVDLDGARDGTPVNFPIIAQIVRQSGLAVQVGGGIRTEARIREYLDLGVARVILGSAAAKDPDWTRQMAERFGPAIAVGVDVRDGRVAVHGWETLTDLDALDFCHQLEAMGVSTIVYTDISKDGMLQGTNLEIYRRLTAETSLQVIASGGISFADEIRALRDMGVYGAIVGKALYEGALDLSQALALAEA